MGACHVFTPRVVRANLLMSNLSGHIQVILQTLLPFTPWEDPRLARLPGILPAGPDEWLSVDEVYGPQMAERARLIATQPELVHALAPTALPAAQELLDMSLDWMARHPDFRWSGGAVTCPDGREVPIDQHAPLRTLGHLLQEDLCLLQPGQAGFHTLTGAILCFPASWTLHEKFQQPMTRIHVPVAPYSDEMAHRVQRMFEGLKPGRVLWRANWMVYDDPTLFQPHPEAAPRAPASPDAPFVRSERQSLLKLPKTGAIVFSIHTYLLRRTALTRHQQDSLRTQLFGAERNTA